MYILPPESKRPQTEEDKEEGGGGEAPSPNSHCCPKCPLGTLPVQTEVEAGSLELRSGKHHSHDLLNQRDAKG